jgi:endonuclease
MGWLKQTIGKDREVNGIIVARAISDNLRYAASVVQYVRLFEYEIAFKLRSAHELRAAKV